jgi:hypothetical protein
LLTDVLDYADTIVVMSFSTYTIVDSEPRIGIPTRDRRRDRDFGACTLQQRASGIGMDFRRHLRKVSLPIRAGAEKAVKCFLRKFACGRDCFTELGPALLCHFVRLPRDIPTHSQASAAFSGFARDRASTGSRREVLSRGI